MVQDTPRAGFAGPALARLLTRLTGAPTAGDTGQLPADRLGQWLSWTDAIALSAVLDRDPPPARSGEAGEPAAECAQARRALTEAIEGDELLSGAPRREPTRSAARNRLAPALSAADYASYRGRYVLLQRAMETRISGLRARLRTALAARGGGMARLAAADAVMEPVTSARERSVLGPIPALLEKRFAQLREAAGDAPEAVWLDTFRQDMRGVLLAELDVRLLPVEGLAEALEGR